jgi:hypothetical protein
MSHSRPHTFFWTDRCSGAVSNSGVEIEVCHHEKGLVEQATQKQHNLESCVRGGGKGDRGGGGVRGLGFRG